MGNWVTYDARPDIEDIKMSNRLTSVFISVLSLATSALAETERHRDFAVWIASHDQTTFGIGCVGFDVSKMPWSTASFDEDKHFLLRSVEAARNKLRWEKLGFEPRDDYILPCLEMFLKMIEAFDIEHALLDDEKVWTFVDPPEGHVLCEKHQAYQHEHGCVICHDT